MELLFYFGTFLFLLILGYVIGTSKEKNHYKSIIKREKELLRLPTVTMRREHMILEPKRKVAEQRLVSGCVAVSVDYFKSFAASLRNLVGGNVSSFESLVDRGRREAILRMKESAGDVDLIANMRLETSPIYGSNGQAVKCITVYAYGTAIKYQY